jgi:5'-nucleotidase
MRNQKLVVAVSSRTLFNLDDSHAIFETQGKEAFCRYQIEHEDEILATGRGRAIALKIT